MRWGRLRGRSLRSPGCRKSLQTRFCNRLGAQPCECTDVRSIVLLICIIICRQFSSSYLLVRLTYFWEKHHNSRKCTHPPPLGSSLSSPPMGVFLRDCDIQYSLLYDTGQGTGHCCSCHCWSFWECQDWKWASQTGEMTPPTTLFYFQASIYIYPQSFEKVDILMWVMWVVYLCGSLWGHVLLKYLCAAHVLHMCCTQCICMVSMVHTSYLMTYAACRFFCLPLEVC